MELVVRTRLSQPLEDEVEKLAGELTRLFLVFATAWSARLLGQALTGLDVRLALALAVLAGSATVWQVARPVRKLLR